MNNTLIPNKLKTFFLSNPKIISRVFFAVLIVILLFILLQRYQYLREVEKTNANTILETVEKNIEQSINSALLASITLALSVNDEGIPEGFENLGKQIVDENEFVDGIQLVPDGVIKYVYPFQKNKIVINYNILEDPKTKQEAYKAIREKKFYIAGPLNLKQGGRALIGRLPIFRKNKFWGFSAVLIYFDTFIKNTGIDTTGKSGFYFQISKKNPNTLVEEKFLPIHNYSDAANISSTNFREGNWTISVIPVNEFHLFRGLYILGFVGLLSIWAFSSLLYNILSRPAKLEKLVLERTQELEKSESEIRKSEEKYRTLIERVSDAFVALDKDGNYTYVNKLAGKIFGREPKDLLGKNIWEEFPEGIGKSFHLNYVKAMKEQKYQYMLEYYEPYDKWFENHIYPSPEGLSIYFEDVTEQKKSDILLKQSLQRNTAFLNALPDLIFVINNEGIFIDFHNPNDASTYTSPDHFLGKNLTESLPSELAEESLQNIKKVLKKKEPSLHQYRLNYPEGDRDFEARYAAVSETEVLVIVRDITEQKKAEDKIRISEEKYRSLIEQASDGIVQVDEKGTIILVNSAFCNMLCYTQDEVLKMKIVDTYLEQEKHLAAQRLEQVIREGEISFERTIIGKNGKELPVEISVAKSGTTQLLGIVRDISERKIAESKILNSQKQLEFISNHIPFYLAQCNENKIYKFVNEPYAKLFGYKPNEVIGKHPSQILGEDAFKIAKPHMDLALNGQMTNYDLELKKDGKEIIVSVKYIPEFNSKGQIAGFIAAISDITERKKSEEAIFQLQESHFSIISSIDGIVWEADAITFQFTFVSKQAEKILGYDLREWTDQPTFWTDHIHKEDRNWAINYCTQCTLEKEDHEFEYRMIAADGRIVWLRDIVTVKSKNNKPFKLVGIMVDITDQKLAEEKIRESEKKYRTLTESSQDYIMRYDIEHRHVYMNKAALDVSGLKESEIIGKTHLEAGFDPEQSAFWEEKIATVFKTGNTIHEQFSWKGVNGLVHLDWRLSPELDENGVIKSLLGVSRDITELKKTEKMLEAQNKELQKTNSELDRFVYSTSHDLRAPLKSMLGLIGIAKDTITPDNETLHKLVEMMNKSVLKLDSFIEDILHYSRNTRTEVMKEEIDFEEMLQEIKESLKYMGGMNELDLQVHIIQKEKFVSDKRRIQVILTNLVSNAIKYCDTTKKTSFAKICIQCDKKNSNIVVEDNGIGIAESDKEKVFEMFYRATILSSGSGLGLYIVKEAIEKLGATIHLESEIGRGTKISVTIPNKLN